MDENVELFTGATTRDHDPYVMLSAASRANLKGVVILGEDADGELFFSSSFADGGDALWWMEMAKHALLMMAMTSQMQERSPTFTQPSAAPTSSPDSPAGAAPRVIPINPLSSSTTRSTDDAE